LGGTLKEAVGREVSAAVLRDATAASLQERTHVAAVLAHAASLACSRRNLQSLDDLVGVAAGERHATLSAEVADQQSTAAAALGVAATRKFGNAQSAAKRHGGNTLLADTAPRASLLLAVQPTTGLSGTAEAAEAELQGPVLASYEQVLATAPSRAVCRRCGILHCILFLAPAHS
jgi:hypothetical protein